MEPGTVAAALGIVEKVSKGLNWVRERAKTSKDSDLKDSISALYDDFLDLKAVVVRLTEENAELRRKLEARPQRAPGQTCPRCGLPSVRVASNMPHPDFPNDITIRTLKCEECGYTENKSSR